jgi:transcription antitermination factor NusG
MSDSWYALHVRSGFEKLVQTQLTAKGFQTLLPTYIATRRWSDRLKQISLPLFDNYVFCRFDVNRRLPILVTPGVNSIVGAGKIPIPVDQVEIEKIVRVIESNTAGRPWPYLEEGECVRVSGGVLEGLTGLIVREKGCDRVVISVTLVRCSMALEIDRRYIQRCDPSPIVNATTSKLHSVRRENTGRR